MKSRAAEKRNPDGLNNDHLGLVVIKLLEN